MNEMLVRQLALDYCCDAKDILTGGNVFTLYEPREGRRRFREPEALPLKVAAVNEKLLFTGRGDIVSACREKYLREDARWFMDAQGLFGLSSLLEGFDVRIREAHPFFIRERQGDTSIPEGISVRMYSGAEIEAFRGDSRFDEAFGFCPEAPDAIGISASAGPQILGMAGASEDSPYMMQIGINVLAEARGRHTGAMLVSLLADRVLKEGRLPFYGTAMSHIASQRVALRAGFQPAWAELVCVSRDRAD